MSQHNDWRTWAQLDLADIMNWPSAPRRLLLIFISLMLLTLVCLWSLIPLWQTVQTKQAHTIALQQQYRQFAQLKAQKNLESQDIDAQKFRSISVQDTPQWYADLVTSATTRRIYPISLTPVSFKQETPKPNQSSNLVDQLAANSGVGQLMVEVEGNYADVLTWTHQLAKRPEIISLENMIINGISNNKVRAKMQLFFIKGTAQ